MDYEIEWRDEADFRQRLEMLRSKHGDAALQQREFRMDEDVLLVLHFPNARTYAWVCLVAARPIAAEIETLIAFAKARYGL